MPALRKCLIANRGEIAVRILRACRENGIAPVAVYSTADASARHVLLADEAYAVGDAPPALSYLKVPALLAAAQQAGCDSVHPGYGFLAENAAFAQAVQAAGLIWVGPPPAAIAAMGVKTAARALMQAAGVPVVPGFQSDSTAEAPFLAAAAQVGLPLMVKAAGGGGGKGIRIVRHLDELPEALAAARREAAHAFGDGRIFLERYIEHGRHVEIQVLADAFGHTVHLFERECSTQRRHQKIIEEAPSPALTPALRQAMGAAAVAAAQAVGYVNAGTVEFILSPAGEFYFLEMNTRLQVEHPVTELITGLDLVALQLRIAAGEPLPFAQADLSPRGHAIECRLYAEDPRSQFVPATGIVQHFSVPLLPGVRVDSGVQAGDAITLHYDPLIAKIIVHAPDRPAAIARMQQALAETVLLGPLHNRDFLQAVLAHPEFAAGRVDTSFVDTRLAELLPPLPPLPDLALIAAALADGQTVPAAPAAPDSDPYSPWARTDSFSLGG
ncbi:MAG: ATP-grasp domain-containing protein [Anaerolineae bacterium]|jgi:acetyl-CoA carboxylase biotin carboxylase subunit|nr:ATP-grasp domain-containing protein [Anaerolineae bacterium]